MSSSSSNHSYNTIWAFFSIYVSLFIGFNHMCRVVIVVDLEADFQSSFDSLISSPKNVGSSLTLSSKLSSFKVPLPFCVCTSGSTVFLFQDLQIGSDFLQKLWFFWFCCLLVLGLIIQCIVFWKEFWRIWWCASRHFLFYAFKNHTEPKKISLFT